MHKFQSLRGMVDLLPAQIRLWQMVESKARKHFRRAIIDEIRTPILESTELFARGIGEGTDVVGKEMYTFVDRGDRSCTLRPEGTASVVRAIIENGLINQGPQRLWYSGPMFRYERPQAGRQRQFHQIGVEFFGLDSVNADADLISIAWDLLNDLGLKGLTLELNTLGSLDDRNKFRALFVKWLEDRFELLDQDSKERVHKNPLRILDTKNPRTKELLMDAPSLNNTLCNESRQRFESLQEILNNLEIPFKLNFGLVRGLDYYCHTAFEITSDDLGAQATVCGGGRYDGLVKQLGGPDVSSIGWAIGVERLILLLEKSNSNSISPYIYLVNKGNKASLVALSIARKLRLANFSIDIDFSGSAFSKQFKRASRSGAKWAIILGDDEVDEGRINVKKMRSDKDLEMDDLLFSLYDLEGLISFFENSSIEN
ncbi:histidine--tRNA ligase [Prochlorococcus sp. MIT 1223]|uniref:histidine--tRNA ligase n=1 Tax=Prochlorococcus sp. MIT 1223 TaxID=3096217 RepID=UPI002A74FF94|nr:histidine--tRNA ligase [Prochlorococcus sp. MIT 1223]